MSLSEEKKKKKLNDDEKHYAPSGYHDHLSLNFVETVFCAGEISSHFVQMLPDQIGFLLLLKTKRKYEKKKNH